MAALQPVGLSSSVFKVSVAGLVRVCCAQFENRLHTGNSITDKKNYLYAPKKQNLLTTNEAGNQKRAKGLSLILKLSGFVWNAGLAKDPAANPADGHKIGRAILCPTTAPKNQPPQISPVGSWFF